MLYPLSCPIEKVTLLGGLPLFKVVVWHWWECRVRQSFCPNRESKHTGALRHHFTSWLMVNPCIHNYTTRQQTSILLYPLLIRHRSRAFTPGRIRHWSRVFTPGQIRHRSGVFTPGRIRHRSRVFTLGRIVRQSRVFTPGRIGRSLERSLQVGSDVGLECSLQVRSDVSLEGSLQVGSDLVSSVHSRSDQMQRGP